jgi:hypothetical protein
LALVDPMFITEIVHKATSTRRRIDLSFGDHILYFIRSAGDDDPSERRQHHGMESTRKYTREWLLAHQ